MDRIEYARRFGELIDALDEERRKMEAFHRELPLCLHLINQTIESYKQLMVSAETLSHELAVKEFMPLRPRSVSSEDDTIHHREWIRSTQLVAQEQDPLPKTVHPQKPIAIKAKKTWGDAQYLDKEEEIAPSESLACQDTEIASGEEGNGDGGKKKKKEISQPERKVKRYWSEELHKRFLHALEQLGGCHAATPKLIRKLMKVDGLTNDEVKSHLQKYRLHARRSSPVAEISTSSNIQFAQFVVVRGVWIPTPDCTILTSTDAAAHAAPVVGVPETGRYAPVSPLPSPLMILDQSYQQTDKHSKGRNPRE
ncbi:hypothetical protein C4D60_Mb04t03670 [Musa balbisiana]|uniref:HTH myb-type domain-containing protein n=1 Tax=Musa balbisiana TaxID=52838 RepID=A0A4S8K9H3_MUSBA|nr:hypothetical protein C4D60_Mb04t03670 [Musa balbisiana]